MVHYRVDVNNGRVFYEKKKAPQRYQQQIAEYVMNSS